MRQSTNHEHFLVNNQAPLLRDNATVISSQNTRMDYVTIEGIENRTGVGEENLYLFILKELLDNASDFTEMESAKEAKVKVTILKEDAVLRIIVRNTNSSDTPPFSKDKLESIFNFDIFYSSKRNQYRLNRGALGDAFKEILCVPYALARKYGID
jgi:signal transduction histidine kinase